MDNTKDCSNNPSEKDPLVFPDQDHKLNLIQTFLKQYSDKETIRESTSMHIAEGQKEIVLFIAKRDSDGNTLLHLAIQENQTKVFNQIIKECNVNAKNNKGESPLHYAAANNRVEFTKALVENGAIVNVEDNDGKTPLHLALTNQNVQLSEILFENRAVVSKKYSKESGPLYDAAKSGNLEMVKLLMMNGFKTVDGNGDSNCPLVAAVWNGHLEVVKYLMRKGNKHIKTITVDRFELLKYCVKPDRADIFKYLVDVGVKTTIINLLTYARQYCCYNVWKYLLTSGSKVNANTCSQETELHWALRAGQMETVKIIVNSPANYFENDSLVCKLAVHIAVENGNEDILELLLNEGFSFEGCFENIKPIHVAATFESTRLVELLLKAGADINSIVDHSLTPLHFAASTVQPTVVKFLLEKGADPHKTCDYDSSPLTHALDMLKGLYGNHPTISTLMYKNILKIMEMLIPKVAVTPDYWNYAIEIEVSRDKSDAKSEQDINNSKFQLAMIKIVFNYLKQDEVTSLSLCALNGKKDKLIDSPELLHIVMEYNDLKSCSDIEIRLWKNTYECNLLLISYADSVKNLTNIEIEFKDDASYQLHGKDKTVFLKLIIARLVLIVTNYNSKVVKFCKKHNLNDWRKECRKQKFSLQETKVDDNLNLTFYDVLTLPVGKFAKCTRNESFLQNIASSHSKFPAYAEFLRVSIEKGQRRNDLINDCVNHIISLVDRSYKIRISKSDIHEIFHYLSVFDLRRFSAACSTNFFRL
ncbi:ankyrin-2-like [Leptopilina heterotoma]|uniref:ankyrin-2-like n=1 Tax=Leptopilina heterotoma TaxID=63436 RepID=UPI001CA9B5AD|nr:ankyrin-2-like [Leptopilina heterotoma]